MQTYKIANTAPNLAPKTDNEAAFNFNLQRMQNALNSGFEKVPSFKNAAELLAHLDKQK